VTVLSGQSTDMAGDISATGGPRGGDGGFVEVSGAQVALTGLVDTSAPMGTTGTLLLDPSDLWISDVSPPDAPAGFSWVSPLVLEGENTNIALSATDNLYVATTHGTSNVLNLGTNALSLTAGIDLSVDRGFAITANGISLTATAGSITLGGSAGVAGGLITLPQLNALGPTSLQMTTGGDVTLAAATGIALGDSVIGSTSLPVSTFNVSTAAGGVTQTTDGAITAIGLFSSGGVGGSLSLPGTDNAIRVLASLAVNGGDLTVVDNVPLLALAGAFSANNMLFENMQAGGEIQLGYSLRGAVLPANLTAATGDRISLVADNLGVLSGSSASAPGGMIEIAPFTPGTGVTLGDVGGLSLPQDVLSSLSTDTLRVGAATINGAKTITAGAITTAGTAGIDLAGIATTLDLEANGPITGTAQPLLNVGTLTAIGGAIDLVPTTGSNTISNLGNVDASGFALSDGGDLNVIGNVAGGTAATIDATGSVTVSDTIGGSAIALTGSSLNIAGGEINDGGSGSVTLIATSGGITETSGTLVIGTLSGNAAGAVSLLGSDNSVATLGSFTVGGTFDYDFALKDNHALTVDGPLIASGNVYLQSSDAGGITVTGGIGSGSGFGSGTVGVQADAFSMGPKGTISADTFELAPNAPGLGMTLGADTPGLALSSLDQIGAFRVRIGAVTEPGDSAPTTTAGSINIAGDFGASNISLELDATGNVTESLGAGLTTRDLTGTAASFSLTSTTNAIAEIDTMTATGGDITVVDDTSLLPGFDDNTLLLSGMQSGRNLFFKVNTAGGAIAIGSPGDGNIISDVMSAATGGRISLVADNITTVPDDPGTSINAPGGQVELAPFSAINTSLLGSNGLVIDQQLLSYITPTGTLVIGGYTNVPAGAAVPAASASSVSIDGGVSLTATATTLDLLATGAATEPGGPVTVGTLIGDTGSALLGSNNDIGTLGPFTTTSGAFNLDDTGNAGVLTISGPVHSAANVTLTGSATGAFAVTGDVTGGDGSTVMLNAGTGGISLGNASVLGAPGNIVDLTSRGGVVESGTATISAATLQSSFGVGGAVTLLNGNNVAGIGNFAVGGGNAFQLTDTINLAVNGTLNAVRIVLRDGGHTVTLGDGATIVTGGVTPPIPGPINPSKEPSNGAPGAFVQAASFTQVGSSSLSGAAGGPATLEINITARASFDPPLGLQAPGGWLILNLANGTATGNVFVRALNVTHDRPGGATLTGTINGVDGPLASSLGANQPQIDPAYTFNGCVIGGFCLTQSPGQIAMTGPLYPMLNDPLPPLATLTPLVLLAYPLQPVTGDALTNPDVVPPNVSFVDY
jgi:hypothetical protein